MKRFIPMTETKRNKNITPEIVMRNNMILNYYFGVKPYPKKSATWLARKCELSERVVRSIIARYRHLVGDYDFSN